MAFRSRDCVVCYGMEPRFKDKEPEELFKEIYEKCRARGLSHSQISKLPAVREMRERRKSAVPGFWPKWFAVIMALLGISIHFRLYTADGFTKVYFFFADLSIEREECTIEMPTEVQNAFMPPFDCRICQNLTEVEKVSNISPREFEKRFAYSGVPVVVVDGTRNWTAPKVFNFAFFRHLYLGENMNGISVWEIEKECQFFPYQTEFTSLTEVLLMNEDRAHMKKGSPPWYIGWSNCDFKVGNILRRHYHKPYFLPLQSESANIDWIFMGTPGYGAHMHIDHVNHPSWQAQIKGRKLWTLEPAPECYSTCRALDVTVEPGEVIVLDTNRWYHKTLIVGDELSITIGSEYD